ncbi:hypothetical protein FORC065_3195 [Yersinia enterocolitica]|nr:hypothetical protein FORC065_3195 [Yersinia enterocolitica]
MPLGAVNPSLTVLSAALSLIKGGCCATFVRHIQKNLSGALG